MRSHSALRSAAVVASTLTFAASALAGPDWVEIGDAGSDVRTAQVPLRPPGGGQLATIAGSLDGRGADFEDLYFIAVTDPVTFSITTGSADFDPVLYLFNVTVNNEALGLLGNNDQAAGNPLARIVSPATDGTGVVISSPGDYIIAVAGSGRFPVSSTGAIFNFASLTEISGADGVGGLNVLSGWSGDGATGSYQLVLVSGDFPEVPAPGAAALLALGVVAGGRRRR